MMYTSPKIESEEAARSQLEPSETANDGYQGQEKESKIFNKNV